MEDPFCSTLICLGTMRGQFLQLTERLRILPRRETQSYHRRANRWDPRTVLCVIVKQSQFMEWPCHHSGATSAPFSDDRSQNAPNRMPTFSIAFPPFNFPFPAFMRSVIYQFLRNPVEWGKIRGLLYHLRPSFLSSTLRAGIVEVVSAEYIDFSPWRDPEALALPGAMAEEAD